MVFMRGEVYTALPSDISVTEASSELRFVNANDQLGLDSSQPLPKSPTLALEKVWHTHTLPKSPTMALEKVWHTHTLPKSTMALEKVWHTHTHTHTSQEPHHGSREGMTRTHTTQEPHHGSGEGMTHPHTTQHDSREFMVYPYPHHATPIQKPHHNSWTNVVHLHLQPHCTTPTQKFHCGSREAIIHLCPQLTTPNQIPHHGFGKVMIHPPLYNSYPEALQ